MKVLKVQTILELYQFISVDAMARFKRMLSRIPGPPIDIKNDIDRQPPPADFIYITEPVYGRGVTKPDASFLVGCACYVADERGRNPNPSCCIDEECICLPDGQGAYGPDGLLLPETSVIYECNSRCCCRLFSQPCRNSVIQRGRQVSLSIVRLDADRGWGVIANHDIPRGSFIDVYLGEIITTTEATERFYRAKRQGTPAASYLFDLDYNYESGTECEFTLDAYRYGNVSHFFNHSCDPNMRVYPCFTENQDARMHSIAFFSCRDIKKGDELTFDYLGLAGKKDTRGRRNSIGGSDGDGRRVKCLCKSANCRKYIYLE